MSRAEVPPSSYRERGRNAPKLSFDAALDTLQAMFQGWTREALAQMLKANNLNMELTIESILSIGAPSNSFGDSSSEGISDVMIAPDDDEERAKKNVTSTAHSSQAQRGRPIVLPDDFLPVPGTSKLQQLDADEQLAKALQDELFLAELSGNPEFAPFTTRHQQSRRPNNRAHQGYPASYNGRSGNTGAQDDNNLAAIKKGLSEMGDTMKRKMGAMYSRFLKAGGDGRRGGRDNSHVALLDDDEGEVVLFNNSSTSSSDTSARTGRDGGRNLLSPQGVELSNIQSSSGRGGRTGGGAEDEEEEVVLSVPLSRQRLV